MKKVEEGLEVYRSLHESAYSPLPLPQKQKINLELKKEIKKLQRFRASIISWISKGEIREPQQLIEAKQEIEKCMKLQIQWEKDFRDKDFKRGESEYDGDDNENKLSEHEELNEWIDETVSKFEEEKTKIEEEIDNLRSLPGKGSKKQDELNRQLNVALLIELHCEQLGRVKRALHNGQITEDDVRDIRQSIDSLFTDEFVWIYLFIYLLLHLYLYHIIIVNYYFIILLLFDIYRMEMSFRRWMGCMMSLIWTSTLLRINIVLITIILIVIILMLILIKIIIMYWEIIIIIIIIPNPPFQRSRSHCLILSSPHRSQE